LSLIFYNLNTCPFNPEVGYSNIEALSFDEFDPTVRYLPVFLLAM